MKGAPLQVGALPGATIAVETGVARGSGLKKERIVPIILAAGRAERLGFPQALGEFGGRTAIEIAVDTCARLGRPIVVLGDAAERVRRVVPRGTRVVVNRRWRSGQLSSLLAGLRLVPRDAAFLVYPVDHPLIGRRTIDRLARAFAERRADEKIVMPRRGKRAGHPVIFSAELRSELEKAKTAREVSYRDSARVRFVDLETKAIWEDFDSPASYRRVAKRFKTPARHRD
jgi:molybdenum cofactor cytidylyltransferase